MTDSVYRERAHLVAHLAALYPSHIGPNDPTAPDWAVLTVEAPTGQMSWHIAPSDMDLFEHVPTTTAERDWDGHSTEEKYARLRALTRIRSRRSCEECVIQADATGAVVVNDPCEEHS